MNPILLVDLSARARRAADPARIKLRFSKFVNCDGPIVRPELGPCWLWTGSRAPNGYPKFSIYGKPRYAHRVAWFLEHGEWPADCACHHCDNGHLGCVRPSHLFNGTKLQNSRDMAAKGRATSHTAKLPPDDVVAIRRLRSEGKTFRVIAAQFGVAESQAYCVAAGKTWKNVP
jgi:hypothetical protein